MDFSAREAAKRLHPVEVVHQRHFIRTHVCTTKEGPQELLMFKKETRKLKEMEELINDDFNNSIELIVTSSYSSFT